jgi:hypothetical protein
MLSGFTDLVRRHRVDPGRLVHVGETQDRAIPTYYDAGYFDITIVESDPQRVRAVRTRFPGVSVIDTSVGEYRRLDAVADDAHTLVINDSGHELKLLTEAPWASLELLIVATDDTPPVDGPSPYDLVTEAVTTRGFVEVDSWPRRGGGAGLDVAFMKIAD